MSTTAEKVDDPRYNLRNWLIDRTLRGLIGLARVLPYRWRIPLMGWLVARVVAPVAGYRKRIRTNLAHVLPELPATEVEKLCLAVPDNAGRTLMEIYSGREFVERARKSKVSGPGLKVLEETYATKRPMILVTGHFGNYDAARVALMARGYDMGALYRAMSNPYFNEHYVRAINEIGTPMFEQGRRGMVEMVRHLRNGGVLAIVTDLNAYGGMLSTFFGKPARTSTVTAELALKYDAELIPVFAIRQPNGLDFEIVVQDPIPRSDAETMTQLVNDRLEALVRENMGQWFWIHRRWKAEM